MRVNEPNASWHHFVRSRFEARLLRRRDSISVAIDIQRVELGSAVHADLAGVMEHSSGSSLPVVTPFTGTLDLESRELLMEQEQRTGDASRYAGRFSENGRVLTLRAQGGAGFGPGEIHLIHEATRRELFGA